MGASLSLSYLRVQENVPASILVLHFEVILCCEETVWTLSGNHIRLTLSCSLLQCTERFGSNLTTAYTMENRLGTVIHRMMTRPLKVASVRMYKFVTLYCKIIGALGANC